LKSGSHGFDADGIGQAQHHHLVGRQFQGPSAATLGWVGAGQLHQSLLDVALDLDLVGPGRLGLGIQGGGEASRDQAFADATDGTDADPQSSDDPVIGVSCSGRRGIRQ
jgi:hypothetical protein